MVSWSWSWSWSWRESSVIAPGARVVLAVAFALILAVSIGCGAEPPDGSSSSAEATSAEQLVQELLMADRAFNRSTEAEGVEGWVSTFAEDGKLFRSAGGIAEGHEAIRREMAALSEPGFSLKWEPQMAEASASGDLGYTIGTYRSQQTGADGNEIVATGRHVTIWRRDASGEWKVVVDIGNPDAPPIP